jgi:DSBA-like thioredoxin domain
MNLSVDVISDVICPWCFIGKRRLEKAIADLEGEHGVRVRWLPFQLNPQMPKEGISVYRIPPRIRLYLGLGSRFRLGIYSGAPAIRLKSPNPMKYSLRRLMIVVTLICILLGSRIEYLRRWAVFHEHEAEVAEGSFDLFWYGVHTLIAHEYRAAMSRPWSIVDDWPPYFQNPFARPER